MDYSFIRENFDINSISKSILSIQVSPDGFSFVICPADQQQSPDYIYIFHINPQTENLEDALTSFTGFDLMEFHSIRIIFHETTFALIPETIYDPKDMMVYHNLNHPSQPNRKVLSNEITSVGAVCVFSIEDSLYTIFKKKFPVAVFCHSSLPFCTMALNKGKDGCFIHVYEKSMELAIVKEQKLVLYNIYALQDGNDIVYFILNAFKSYNLDPLIDSLYIAGILPDNSGIVTILRKYIQEIRFYITDYVIVQESGEFDYPSHYFLNHREILNCEL